MYQNIKVDLIYYNTPADYEMEFNLAGCCRMRLLSDKTTTIKAFLQSLARAVERSRIILGIGPLFGDNGLLSIVSHAIGYPMIPVDCAAYGLQSDAPLSLIANSTPLVTDNGILAGCIIESGPQIMILLSENKMVRKTVMIPLIHPYIAQLSIQDLESDSSETASAKSVAKPMMSKVVPSSPKVNAPLFESQKEPDVEFINLSEKSASSVEPAPPVPPKPAEPQTAKIPSHMVTEEESYEPDDHYILDLDDPSLDYDYDDDGEDPDFIMDPDPNQKKRRGSAIQNNIDFISAAIDSEFHFGTSNNSFAPKLRFHSFILVLFIVLLVILVALIFLIVFLPLRSGISPLAYFKDIFQQLAGRRTRF